MTLFESEAKSTDQPTASDSGSNVSGGLRKIVMVVAIGGLAYLAIRRSRSEARSGERIRTRVAAAVDPSGAGPDGTTDRGQPASGGVGVPSSASDGDSGSVEGSGSGGQTDDTVEESEPTGNTRIDDEPGDDESGDDESVTDEPIEDAETAVDEVEDADEHPTEPGTMDVDRDVVEEAVDDEAVDDANESGDRSAE
ncbi:hypothetical protein BV210_10875 [Halorientalis sp. IM1011]|uniref:hypothetical protein n=1 Tax=Halorientalis sp. IM1011 TaxID=1932360 RepID=UPI00097CC888|nr:hypothetical protein [Halorientalis sp. IM1011]AQL43189.1 hypothetical protein BV210_10875 [Halorientalis sp. IM1011]